LYDLDFELTNDQKNMDIDTKSWLNLTADSANDTSKWFERDLNDFLREIHRESEDADL